MKQQMNSLLVNIYMKKIDLYNETDRYFLYWADQNARMDKVSHDYKLLYCPMVF